MSRSFDSELHKRLNTFEGKPSPNAKDKLFASLATPTSSGFNRWQVLAAVLISIALIQMLPKLDSTIIGASEPSQLSVEPNQIAPGGQLAQPRIIQPRTDSLISTKKTEDRSDRYQTLESMEDRTTIVKESDGLPSTVSEETPLVSVYGDKEPLTSIDHNPLWEVSSNRREELQSIEFSQDINPIKENNEERFLWPYLDFGLFFVYQELQPNLDDDLVIENLQSTERFSPKRLGFYGEVGVRKPIGKHLNLFLGGTFNRYNQQYRFEVRGTKPEGALISESSESTALSIEPLYNQSIIDIEKPLWIAGLKSGINWYILPNRSSSLFLAAEYNHVLNGTYSFDFEGNSYDIAYPHQWLLNVGLRKVIVQNKAGDLTVVPNVRYSWLSKQPNADEALSLKPFSVGITFSYLFGGSSLD